MWRRLYRNGIEARDNFLYYLNRNVWVATVGNADTPLNDAVGVRIAMNLTNDMFVRNNDFFTILGDKLRRGERDLLHQPGGALKGDGVTHFEHAG